MISLDWVNLDQSTKIFVALPLILGAAFLHLYFGWRLGYLRSMTNISLKLARGVEPDPQEVLKFTE